MTSAFLNAEYVHAACRLAYVEHREKCKREAKDDEYGPESHLYRLDFLGGLAEAAVAAGQENINVSLDDYIILHSYFSRLRPPKM